MKKYRILPYKGPQHSLFLKQKRFWAPYILSAFLTVALAVGGTTVFIYRDLSSAQTTDTQVAKLLKREAPPSDNYSGRPINILIMGSDKRPEGNAEHVEGMRSDTTILMHISADRKRVEAVSIPRDMMVDIPSCERPDGSTTRPTHAQFNDAFSLGGLTGNVSAAIACTIKTVEKITDIRIDEFIMVDMYSMVDMVNALGGVNLWSDIKFHDRNSNLELKAGCNHLDGEQAVAFARTREGIGDGSDLQRIKRQQRLMGLMYRTALSKNLTTDLPALYAFGRAALASLRTSEGLELTKLAGIAYSLSSLNLDNMLFVSLPVMNSPNPHEKGRVVATPQAKKVWEALKTDSMIPAGLEVRDGHGNAYIYTGKMVSDSSKNGSKDNSEEHPGREKLTGDDAPLSSSQVKDEAAREKCEP